MPELLCFGRFTFIVPDNALYKGAARIRLQEHSATVLRVLLEHPGEVVSRDDIRARVWPNGTLVEFDHGINTAVNRLRSALGDRADKPRYIETVARRGYRFIAEVRRSNGQSPEARPKEATVSTPEIAPGAVISHYRIVRLIGSGAIGDVYEAVDLNLGRRVALKFLTASGLLDEWAVERFRREARALSAIDHPNICSVYEFDSDRDRGFLAMQLLDGETLADRIQRQGRLDIPAIVQIASQVAAGLEAAHDKHIIHRDIKPANLFLTRTGQVKILDFGLARIPDSEDVTSPGACPHPSPLATAAGKIMGTAAYMSPEQIQGQALDTRTDIFSFGLVLYEMATGTHPFPSVPESDIRRALTNDAIADASVRNGSLPPWLIALISRSLAKQREHCIQKVHEIRRTLEAHTRPAALWRTRKVTIAATALVAGVALWASQLSRKPESSSSLTVVPVTSTAGLKEHVAVSPDGSRIAFAWYADAANEDIFIQPVNSHAPVRITTDPARDFSPSWSSDGASIAFLRTMSGRTEIFTVHLAGGPERKLGEVSANPAAFCKQLDWSRTENRLALTEWRSPPSGGSAVVILSPADGKETRRIPIPQSGFVCAPAFSPDGRSVAFLSGPDFRAADVHVVSVNGGHERRVTNDARMMQGLTWAPDGASLVYSLRKSGPFGLWRVALDGSAATPLLETGNDVVDPYWGRTGTGLMFVRDLWDTNLWRAAARTGSAQQSEPAKLVASTREESSVDVSPDGTRIVFASARMGGFELWVADADGSRVRQLTDFGGPETGYPRWSPDGTRIAFNSYPDGKPAVYVVSAEGGRNVRRLADGEMPFWSRAGDSVYFLRTTGGVTLLMSVPASGGDAAVISDAPGVMAMPTADGSHFILERDESLWLRGIREEGPGELIVRSVEHGNWTTIPNGVCYLRRDTTSVNVECLNLRTRVLRSLASFAGWPRVYGPPAFAVSPEGKWVMYGRTDHLESNIMRATPPRAH